MRLSLFDSFADMIEAIPTSAIIRTLERESRMLEEDLAYQRPVPSEEAISILIFCRFVMAIRKATEIDFFAINLPARHLEFYQKTVGRLVDAVELPFKAKEEFNNFVGDAFQEAIDEPNTTQDGSKFFTKQQQYNAKKL